VEEKSARREAESVTRLYLLVEGQTEETFVRELLTPHYARQGIYVTPIIVGTSPRHRGGVVRYAKIKPQLVCLCRQDRAAYVSTMFDLYALPPDFPGKGAEGYPVDGSGRQKAIFLESHVGKDVGEPNFIPNFMVHEFEALLFVQPERFDEWTDDKTVVSKLAAITKLRAPEDINDGQQTAPSKRILEAMPTYQKTLHGPLIACEVGIDALRAACPHFSAWLSRIEQFMP
jgi:hypothetical protein